MTTSGAGSRQEGATLDSRVGAGHPAAGPVLTFDAETHTYRLHDPATPSAWGRVLPSVTQVLHLAGLVDDTWYREEHRIRGRFVHRMIAYEERGGLDESSVDERLAGYLEAYRSFKRDVQPGPCLLLETPLADPVLGFAGCPDQLRPMFGVLAILDHKTGEPAPWHQLQSSAYAYLARECADVWDATQAVPLLKRYALYLKPNGQYRLVEHTDRQDFKVFQSCLTVAHFKEAR